MFWQSDCFSVNLIAVYKQMSDWFLSEMIQLEDVPSMKLFYLVLEHGFCSKKIMVEIMPLPLKMEVLRFWNDSSLILVRYKSERKCDHEMELVRGHFQPPPLSHFISLPTRNFWIPKDTESIPNSEITPKFWKFPGRNYLPNRKNRKHTERLWIKD